MTQKGTFVLVVYGWRVDTPATKDEMLTWKICVITITLEN
jgi:hypothetical protein